MNKFPFTSAGKDEILDSSFVNFAVLLCQIWLFILFVSIDANGYDLLCLKATRASLVSVCVLAIIFF